MHLHGHERSKMNNDELLGTNHMEIYSKKGKKGGEILFSLEPCLLGKDATLEIIIILVTMVTLESSYRVDKFRF
jgi:hypothetical protein